MTPQSNRKLGHLTSGKNTELKMKYLSDENSSPVGRSNWHVVKNASKDLVDSIFRTKESKKIIFQSTPSSQNASNNTSNSFIIQSVLRQINSFSLGEFSKDCDLVLPLSISSTTSFPVIQQLLRSSSSSSSSSRNFYPFFHISFNIVF